MERKGCRGLEWKGVDWTGSERIGKAVMEGLLEKIKLCVLCLLV
jgi:hypothetical protein